MPIHCQPNPLEWWSIKNFSKLKYFHWRKSIWKFCLQHVSHFVPPLMFSLTSALRIFCSSSSSLMSGSDFSPSFSSCFLSDFSPLAALWRKVKKINMAITVKYWRNTIYCKTFNMRHTKYQNLNISCLGLQLSLPNPLKPGVKSRMKM